MTTGDPFPWFNSSERRLEVSELVVGVVRKARLAPGYVATERSWESSSFGYQITRVNAVAQFSLNGFGDPGDGEE